MIDEEYEIIRQCLDGDADSYAVLVDRYKAMAYNIAYRMLGDGDAAKDMAQESFISAYVALGDFKFGSKFSSWLYRIVVNKCRDYLKAGRDTVQVDEIGDFTPAKGRTPEQAVSSRQTGDVIQKALGTLLEFSQEVVEFLNVPQIESQEN